MEKKYILSLVLGVIVLLTSQTVFAQDYWVYSDAYINVYCDSDTLKKDADESYYEVTAKSIDANDGSWMGRQSWRFIKQNGSWKYWHSGMDETVEVYTSRSDQEAMKAKSILVWCQKNS